MALAIQIQHDADKTMAKLRAKIVRTSPRAAATAINRTAQAANTAAVRAIQKDVGASAQRSIRRNVSIKRASAEKPEAQIVARSAKKDRIPIYEMRPRPRAVTKRRPAGGVRYGPQNKLIPGSFIARLASGHVGVFKRLGDARNPIGELFGPSVALVLSRRRVYSHVQTVIAEKLPAELKRALEFGR